MSNDRVYCCNKEATCNNYERSELVFFEQVKFEKGFVWEKWKTSGICWIFLLSGEAGVSIEDEVVDHVPGRWGGLQVFVRRKTGRTICFDEVLLL